MHYTPSLFKGLGRCNTPKNGLQRKKMSLNLFDQMSQRQSFPSVIKFNQLLLGVVTKMKHFSHSLDLFKRMCALRVPVDDYTMNIAINCCCHLSCTNEGFAVFGFFLKRGIRPDAWTFSTLLNGLVREDRILEAEIFFKKLIKDKICEPNVVMYSTMIKGLCKIGNNVIAIQLLRLMVERGCKPNVVTYSNIIDSLCKDKMIDDAFKLFKEMVFQKGISPNVITYNSLIDGLCKLRRREEASKMLKEMLDGGISPDVQTFSILVDAFCKDGKVKEAEDFINIMLQRGIVPNTVTYNSLIDGYCLRGEMTKAKTTFDSLVLRGLVPDIFTCNSLLNGYCKSSKIDEAMYMFHEIAKKGLEPDVVTYSTMIQGLFAVRRCSDARKLFDEMLAKCQLPNECTYQILIEGLCYNHQVEEALSMFQSSGDSKLKANIIVYNILIDGARKCGKLDIAKVLFQDLTHRGLQPNVRTYTVMINVFCEQGQLSDAKQLFLKMTESGCLPDNVAYRNLLQGYLRNKHYYDVGMLLHEMDGRQYTLDVSTLSLLLDRIASGSLDATLLEVIEIQEALDKQKGEHGKEKNVATVNFVFCILYFGTAGLQILGWTIFVIQEKAGLQNLGWTAGLQNLGWTGTKLIGLDCYIPIPRPINPTDTRARPTTNPKLDYSNLPVHTALQSARDLLSRSPNCFCFWESLAVDFCRKAAVYKPNENVSAPATSHLFSGSIVFSCFFSGLFFLTMTRIQN
ncbi:tetratricopeptide-like helical domain-containing protein [Artemisia annua]|uniref:Tetratricopeptide-like helical domain-containing protein n=1 Tax=Artemisia annua TaxID=35608 RepID=A0A2U1NWE6_ARTAN|nr:tetratricopeptide-like helical domain-containing protein [Artemisia annua]